MVGVDYTSGVLQLVTKWSKKPISNRVKHSPESSENLIAYKKNFIPPKLYYGSFEHIKINFFMLNKSLVPFAYTYMYTLGFVLMSKNLCHILYQEPTFYWKDIRIAINSSLAHDLHNITFICFVCAAVVWAAAGLTWSSHNFYGATITRSMSNSDQSRAVHVLKCVYSIFDNLILYYLQNLFHSYKWCVMRGRH